MLQYNFCWKQLSVIAGISFRGFFLPFLPGSITNPQIVELRKALEATIGSKLLIVWDRLQAHRSRVAREYGKAQRDQIAPEYLAAYAPELNPSSTSGAIYGGPKCGTSAPAIAPTSNTVPAHGRAPCNAVSRS